MVRDDLFTSKAGEAPEPAAERPPDRHQPLAARMRPRDLDEFARFMAVTVWLSTMDSILGMGQNFYVYLDPKTHKFQFMPWDLDHSFGQFGMKGSNSPDTCYPS